MTANKMKTLGVDVAAQAAKTAVCLIRWGTSEAKVEFLKVGVTDDRLLELFSQADKVGVDAPLGWPDAFVKAISAHRDLQPWPAASTTELRYRVTDRFVHEKTRKWPLSVAAEKIGAVALRAAALLSKVAVREPVDRTGAARFVEVYPAAGLIRWGFSQDQIKKKNTAGLASEVVKKLGPRLEISEEDLTLCKANRDALDSLVAALIARASALGLCEPIPAEHSALARAEGWIALPLADSLNQLIDDGLGFQASAHRDPHGLFTTPNTTAKQLLILCTTTGYQTQAFVEAAQELGLAVVLGTDRCHVLEDPWHDGALPLRFEDAEKCAEQIVDFSRKTRINAVVALGDRPTAAAARACQALGLPYHPAGAVDACRDKYRSRERLRAGGLRVPAFTRYLYTEEPRELASSGLGFPCVLKPLSLSGSRGVIRADNAEQFVAAFERIRDLLRSPEVQVLREEASRFIQVEGYIEGEEVAVEAVVDRGQLKVLAIFDKPDPLEGPYFEETVYVTPSRLPREVQSAVIDTLAEAVRVLGLYHGPLHAEFRLNSPKAVADGNRAISPPRSRDQDGFLAVADTGGTPVPGGAPDVWVLEIAARSIGGLCSRALRFCSPTLGEGFSLEELLIHLASGENVHDVRRETAASGVMMVPIPRSGIYEGVQGVEQASRTPGVEDIVITAKPGQRLVALPEGSSYLGFIFARRTSPQGVEETLRHAHEKLHFAISPTLAVM
jgi:biotin carboxylase/predicted nuclease with RNAse H fold